MADNGNTETEPLAELAECSLSEQKEFDIDSVQQMIDDLTQTSLGIQHFSNEDQKKWFEQYLVDNNFTATESQVIDISFSILEAIDNQKSKYSYLVARLNNSIDKKQAKIDKDLAPFLEGEAKQAHSIKKGRLAEAKKWMDIESERVINEVCLCS
jgi:hypothetical protein